MKKLDIVHSDIDPQILSNIQRLDEQRILNSNFTDILRIFQSNKSLGKFIYDNTESIIKSRLFGANDIPDDIDDQYDYISQSDQYQLIKFIYYLIDIKEFALAREALRIGATIAAFKRSFAMDWAGFKNHYKDKSFYNDMVALIKEAGADTF